MNTKEKAKQHLKKTFNMSDKEIKGIEQLTTQLENCETTDERIVLLAHIHLLSIVELNNTLEEIKRMIKK